MAKKRGVEVHGPERCPDCGHELTTVRELSEELRFHLFGEDVDPDADYLAICTNCGYIGAIRPYILRHEDYEAQRSRDRARKTYRYQEPKRRLYPAPPNQFNAGQLHLYTHLLLAEVSAKRRHRRQQ